jgi:hypothetical protein
MAALRSAVLAPIANCPLADNRFPVAASPQSDARRGWAAAPCAIMPVFGGTGVARSFWDTFGAGFVIARAAGPSSLASAVTDTATRPALSISATDSVNCWVVARPA